MHNFIVRVFAKSATEKKHSYLGTAFLIDDNYLLTSRHVIDKYTAEGILLTNGPWENPTYVKAIFKHDEIDAALLRVDSDKSKDIVYFNFYDMQDSIGKEVTITGFTCANYSTEKKHTVCGILSTPRMLVLQHKDDHGKSGSPVIYNNTIVGIFCSRSDPDNPKQDNHESYIYPYAAFREFVEAHRPPKPKAKQEYTGAELEKRIAQVDRAPQWTNHIEPHLTDNQAKRVFAFVVAGIKQEWPESLQYRLLDYLGKEETTFKSINFNRTYGSVQQRIEVFWGKLLITLPESLLTQTSSLTKKEQLVEILTKSNTPVLVYWHLEVEISTDLDFIKTVVESWEGLELAQAKQRHCLLIVYGFKESGWSIEKYPPFFCRNPVEDWRKKLAAKLAATPYTHVVVPQLEAITKEHVNSWSKNMDLELAEQRKIDKAMNKIKAKKIPHLSLLDIIKETLLSKNT